MMNFVEKCKNCNFGQNCYFWARNGHFWEEIDNYKKITEIWLMRLAYLESVVNFTLEMILLGLWTLLLIPN